MNPKKSLPFWTGTLWGFLEGTWLFLVPDILLCYWAMKGWRQALLAVAGVVIGAELAAILLYTLLPYSDLSTALPQFWASLPGFTPKMAEVAAGHLALEGGKGLLAGPTSGIPYRAYLVEAWNAQIPLWEILVWTPLARLERILIAPAAVLALRWFLTTVVARSIGTKELWMRVLVVAVVVYWICLYTWYWGTFVPTIYGAPVAPPMH
jgi:hypothetical protein